MPEGRVGFVHHMALLPRLAALLAPGGVLGFQMPGRPPGRSSVYLLDIHKSSTSQGVSDRETQIIM
jgi:trans-aconitate methyltransferase